MNIGVGIVVAPLAYIYGDVGSWILVLDAAYFLLYLCVIYSLGKPILVRRKREEKILRAEQDKEKKYADEIKKHAKHSKLPS